MAFESVDNTLKTQFAETMHILAQQKMSRLRSHCEMVDMRAEDYAYDSLGQVEARELTGRLNLTEFDDIDHHRRQIQKRHFVVTLPIDKMDVAGALSDPRGRYAAACTAAMERAFDRVIYDAMFATVNTGRNFGTPVTATADGVLTVDASGAAITLAKLLAIKQNFLDNEVNVDEEVQILMGVSGDEHTSMLQIDQLVNRFYTDQLRLENGRIRTAVGMDVIIFGANARTPLLNVGADGASKRRCFAFAKGGIAAGVPQDWQIEIDKRTDYVGVWQVQITGVVGAVRTEGKLIQKLLTLDI